MLSLNIDTHTTLVLTTNHPHTFMYLVPSIALPAYLPLEITYVPYVLAYDPCPVTYVLTLYLGNEV
jgi:hypothetical protein